MKIKMLAVVAALATAAGLAPSSAVADCQEWTEPAAGISDFGLYVIDRLREECYATPVAESENPLPASSTAG